MKNKEAFDDVMLWAIWSEWYKHDFSSGVFHLGVVIRKDGDTCSGRIYYPLN